jgi:ankyrin repeat protein
VYPEACQMPDNNGMLPLHRAAQYHPFEVVAVLLQAFPEAAQHPNKIGQLPLHFAAHGGAEVPACTRPPVRFFSGHGCCCSEGGRE